MNVNLVNDQIKAKKLIASPTLKHLEIINSDLVMIQSQSLPKLETVSIAEPLQNRQHAQNP